MHNWEPFSLAPGDPFVYHSFLELSITIKASLRIKSRNMLRNCLCVENGLVFGDKVWELFDQCRGFGIISKPNIKLGTRNLRHGLNHEAHSILGVI